MIKRIDIDPLAAAIQELVSVPFGLFDVIDVVRRVNQELRVYFKSQERKM